MGGGKKGGNTARAILHTPPQSLPLIFRDIFSLSRSVHIIIPVLAHTPPHLICNDQDAMLVAQRAQGPHEAGRAEVRGSRPPPGSAPTSPHFPQLWSTDVGYI